MEEKITEAPAEFSRIVDFVTGDEVDQEIHVVELRICRDLPRLGRVLLGLFLMAIGLTPRTGTLDSCFQWQAC